MAKRGHTAIDRLINMLRETDERGEYKFYTTEQIETVFPKRRAVCMMFEVRKRKHVVRHTENETGRIIGFQLTKLDEADVLDRLTPLTLRPLSPLKLPIRRLVPYFGRPVFSPLGKTVVAGPPVRRPLLDAGSKYVPPEPKAKPLYEPSHKFDEWSNGSSKDSEFDDD